MQAADAVAAARVKYYVGDVNDPAYLGEVMAGVDIVVNAPQIQSERECDENPAEACMTLLNPIKTVMQTAIEQKVQKLVVLGLAYTEPLSVIRCLIAALLEKVVVAQGRHQSEQEDTSISYVQIKGGDVLGLVDMPLAGYTTTREQSL